MTPGKTTKNLGSLSTRLTVALLAFVSGLAADGAWSAATFRPVSKQLVPGINRTAAEEYSVYSSTINGTHNEDRFRMFVIRDRTIPCLRTGGWCSSQHITRLLPKLSDETLNDYLSQNNEPMRLSNYFSLKGSPVMLSDMELPEFLVSSKSRINLSPIPSKKIRWGEFYQNFPLSPGLISLSRIGFNSEMNQALVYQETQGNDNGTWGRYHLLTKRTGRWVVDDTQEEWFPEEPRESVKQGEFGTLKGRILDAKADGETRVDLRILACGWEIGGLREALSRDTVVVAQLRGKKTFQDRDGLYTWYRFIVVEPLSERPIPDYLGFLSFGEAPADMLPVKENEFLIRETNGRMEIDGVTVTQHSNGAKYIEGETYLLFLLLDRGKRIAVRSGTDPIGVFTVDNEGILRAYVDRPYPLKDQIAKRLGNSLNKLRTALKSNF
jgi:hypothetical protein